MVSHTKGGVGFQKTTAGPLRLHAKELLWRGGKKGEKLHWKKSRFSKIAGAKYILMGKDPRKPH